MSNPRTGANRWRPAVFVAVAAAAAAVLVAGCNPADSLGADGTTGGSGGSAPAGTSALSAPTAAQASQLLDGLTVHVADTGAHYKRSDWGDWTNERSDHCTTREQVLRRDGHGIAVDGQCRATCPTSAATPCWTSLYDGVAVTSASKLQIDHVVPVSEAAHSGARSWSAQQRAAFYNDTDNLVAVSVHSNESKGDKDPAVWRPPAHDAWCLYARAYVHIKDKYKLTVDDAEHDALVSMLHTCPAQP